MSRTIQTERPAPTPSNPAGANGPNVALVGGEGPQQRIVAILEEQELEFDLFDTVDDLLEDNVIPSLIVLWIEGALSGSVARNLKPLRRAIGKAPVVMVCAEIRPGELRSALSGGAAGVVLEGQLAAALGPCLQAARAGQICVPRHHSRQIEPAALSSREKQILGLVVMGYRNSQIAEQLFLAESTVKSHLSSAFGKLGVRSRNEAVDLILDSERSMGLGMGILALGGELLERTLTTT